MRNNSAVTVSVFDDLFNSDATIISFGERPNLISYTEDPLVLSCTMYRIGKPGEDFNPLGRFASIQNDQKTIVKHITDEDHLLAKEIRLYYRGKLAFAKLRNDKMSKFRQDLEKFITIDWDPSVKISEDFNGMIYKLPYFYEHDLALVNDVFDGEYHKNKPVAKKEEITLTYIRSLDEYQKRNPSVKYWFKDKNDNRYMITIEKSNSLLFTWEQYIKNPIRISGTYVERAYDTLEFYKVSPGWKILG